MRGLVVLALFDGGCAAYTPNTVITMPPECEGVTITLVERPESTLMVPGMVCPKKEGT